MTIDGLEIFTLISTQSHVPFVVTFTAGRVFPKLGVNMATRIRRLVMALFRPSLNGLIRG
jgi:hypothetical protein